MSSISFSISYLIGPVVKKTGKRVPRIKHKSKIRVYSIVNLSEECLILYMVFRSSRHKRMAVFVSCDNNDFGGLATWHSVLSALVFITKWLGRISYWTNEPINWLVTCLFLALSKSSLIRLKHHLYVSKSLRIFWFLL